MATACFTGHRILSGNIEDLRERLYNIIERAYLNRGVNEFCCGGAIGWDTLSAQCVLALKEKYPDVILHLVLPCCREDQTRKWTDEQRNEFDRIYKLADKVEQLADRYYNGCMKARNARMVELSDYCFCYWDKNNLRSGTTQTVRMAHNKGIMIVNFYR